LSNFRARVPHPCSKGSTASPCITRSSSPESAPP
jgi:hypothetical protein